MSAPMPEDATQPRPPTPATPAVTSVGPIAVTARDTTTCLLLSASLTPTLLWLLFICTLGGPWGFFGTYSSDTGRAALALDAVVAAAASGWGWFFVGYRRSATWARVIGALVGAVAFAGAVLCACSTVAGLLDGPGVVTDEPATMSWSEVVPTALFAAVAWAAAGAIRYEAAHLVGVAAGLVLCLGGLWHAARWLHGTSEALVMPFPLVTFGPLAAGVLLVAVFLPRRARRIPTSPNGA